MVVSGITDELVTALTPKKTELRNSKVAVLKGSQEHSYAFSKQGITLEYESVNDITQALTTGELLENQIISEKESECRYSLRYSPVHDCRGGGYFTKFGFLGSSLVF